MAKVRQGAEATAPEEDVPASPSCSLTTLLACPSLSAPAANHPPASARTQIQDTPPLTSCPIRAPVGSSPKARAIPHSTWHPVLEVEEGKTGAVRAWGLRIPESRACSAGLCLIHTASLQPPLPRAAGLGFHGMPLDGHPKSNGGWCPASSQTTGCVTRAQENPGLCQQLLPSALLRAALVLRLEGWPVHEQPPQGQLTPEAPSKEAGAISRLGATEARRSRQP